MLHLIRRCSTEYICMYQPWLSMGARSPLRIVGSLSWQVRQSTIARLLMHPRRSELNNDRGYVRQRPQRLCQKNNFCRSTPCSRFRPSQAISAPVGRRASPFPNLVANHHPRQPSMPQQKKHVGTESLAALKPTTWACLIQCRPQCSSAQPVCVAFPPQKRP